MIQTDDRQLFRQPRWRRCIVALLLLPAALAGCDTGLPSASMTTSPAAELDSSYPTSARPGRIISLDYCADQFVLKLADREQILAVSPDAGKAFSYMRDAASGLPSVRPRAEDVLIREPDLVVRSYGGGPNASALFQRAGIPVLQVGWAASVDGESLDSISGIIRQMAEGLGQVERGEALIADYQSRLSRIASRSPQTSGRRALYMTPSGVTSGPGSLVHEMLESAGLDNFQTAPGWHSLPLERLAFERPDMIAAAFFEDEGHRPGIWSASRHPVARTQLNEQPVVALQGAWTSCGGWFIVDAIESLAQGVAE